MNLTLGNWLFIVIVGLIFVSIVAAFTYAASDNGIITALVSVIVGLVWFFGLVIGLNWYNTSTASGMRAYKDYQSEMSNGIDREIVITAEDGREIFRYEGKVDVESNHDDNYIKFESEDGKRYIIYYGMMDTITIIEK